MGTSFLNPNSDKSGITSAHKIKDSFFNECTRRDLTLLENIEKAFEQELDLLADMCLPFHLLIGSHYSTSPYDERYNAKGLLDYLFFPLLARKLICDTYLEDRENTPVTNALAWILGGCLELLRLGIGLFLGALFAPVMVIAHFADKCFPDEQQESDDYLVNEELLGGPK